MRVSRGDESALVFRTLHFPFFLNAMRGFGRNICGISLSNALQLYAPVGQTHAR